LFAVVVVLGVEVEGVGRGRERVQILSPN